MRLPDFTGKSQDILHYAPPLPIPCSWEAVCWSCSTVSQSSHFTTVLQTSESMQVSPFSSMMTEGHFSWHAFSNVWKCLLFAGEFCRCVINRLGHTFPRTWNIFTNVALIPRPIRLAASRLQRSLQETSEKLLLLHVIHACTQRFREQICIFLSFAHT